MGKPQIRYSDKVADAICDKLAEGLSLRKVCESNDMPDRKTVTRWLEDHAEFATKYARARDIGLDDRADALREEIELEPDVARARLLLDYGKWYLSKLAPKKYGDKVEVESRVFNVTIADDDKDL